MTSKVDALKLPKVFQESLRSGAPGSESGDKISKS